MEFRYEGTRVRTGELHTGLGRFAKSGGLTPGPRLMQYTVGSWQAIFDCKWRRSSSRRATNMSLQSKPTRTLFPLPLKLKRSMATRSTNEHPRTWNESTKAIVRQWTISGL